VPDSIFAREGDLFRPTEAALSPWSQEALHGGPPTMLLAREIERFPAEQAMFVARLTIELMRPVGMVPLAVKARLLRPGRKIQLVEASLWNGQVEVARAAAVRIRETAVSVPHDDEPPPHGPPESVVDPAVPSYRGGPAYHRLGVEVRIPTGLLGRLGPCWGWFRLKLPVVPGEEPSGLQRICAAADFPNGISNVVEPERMMYINPDLTVYVHRLPVDEWVYVDARTWLEPHGTGFAEGALYDRRGRLGRSLQSLLVEPRPD